MKKTIFLFFLTMVLLNIPFQAMSKELKQCMRELPNKITFVHIKDALQKETDGFVDFEQKHSGYGYSQLYINKTCNITVFVYNAGLPRISANDIMAEQSIAEQQMLQELPDNHPFVEQVYVTYIGDYFLKLRTTCQPLYTGDEARYNDMATRVVSFTTEEQVSAFLNTCLSSK